MQTANIFPLDTARVQLGRHLEDAKISQRKAAKEIGISGTTLSQYLSGIYPGDNAEITEKVNQYLALQRQRKSLVQAPAFCNELPFAREMLDKIRLVHVFSDIGIIYGEAGCGKTTALKRYCESNSEAVYVQADVCTRSVRAILKLILDAIGKRRQGSNSDIMAYLVGYFQDTGTVILIDEAQHLSIKAVEAVRAIHDKAHIGIMFAGNRTVYNRMYGRNEEDFSQFYSRVGIHCRPENQYKAEHIQKLFPDVDNACVRYLKSIANQKGGLRIMIKQYMRAANAANAVSEPIGITHFSYAASESGMEWDNVSGKE